MPEDRKALAVREHAQPDLIEVVYMRYHSAYLYEAETMEDALSFIQYGEDDGAMSSVGVYVNGEPRIWDGYVDQDPPTPEQAKTMRETYREASRD